MGKGKGGRRGVHARLGTGVTLLCFSALRVGLLAALHRRLQVRCNFRVGVRVCPRLMSPHELGGYVGVVPTWVGSQRLQPRYITLRFEQLKAELTRMRRPVL